MKKVISSLILMFTSVLSFGQITVDNSINPTDLINNVLAGPGVTISNITYNGSVANALTTQVQAGSFDANTSGFSLNSGVIISTGNAIDAAQVANTGIIITGNLNGVGDPDLNMLAPAGTNDAVVIEFDFVPIGDSVSFNFVFASEEYPNFAPPSTTQGDPNNYNDVFGFFLSGPGIAGPYSNGAENIAILPNGDPISIDYINPQYNSTYYIHNSGGTSITYEGMSTVLSTILPTNLVCGETYHFKIALADAGDAAYDTAIFLEANSFSSMGASVSIAPTGLNGAPITNNELYEGCTAAEIIMVNPVGYTDSSYTVNLTISGTATNGIDYSTLNSIYIIPPGQDTLIISINTLADAVTEGIETLVIETYYVSACGDTISVFETINILDVAPNYNTSTLDTTITCYTGPIDLTPVTDGGVPNYIYDWGAFGTNQTATVPTNIIGTTPYVVNITDACGITSQGTFNVTYNPIDTVNLTFDNNIQSLTICPTETATFEITNVSNPFSAAAITYNWYNPVGLSTTNTITVSPNVTTWYYVDVFDGCNVKTDSVKVEIGGVTLAAINITPAIGCTSQGTYTAGSIEVLPSTPGWSYSITSLGITIGPQASNTFPNLNGPQYYTITVTDALNCSSDSTVLVGNQIVTVTADTAANVWYSPVTCFGDADGFAEITNIEGGVNGGPYDVTWTNQGNVFSTTNNIADPVAGESQNTLTGGNWIVTIIEDVSGCAWSAPFTIHEPGELIISQNVSEPLCFGSNDGSIITVITGGNGITYGIGSLIITDLAGNVENGSPTNIINTVNNLATDTYTIIAIDDKGCTTSNTFLMDEPEEIAIEFTVTNPNCYGIESGND